MSQRALHKYLPADIGVFDQGILPLQIQAETLAHLLAWEGSHQTACNRQLGPRLHEPHLLRQPFRHGAVICIHARHQLSLASLQSSLQCGDDPAVRAGEHPHARIAGGA